MEQQSQQPKGGTKRKLRKIIPTEKMSLEGSARVMQIGLIFLNVLVLILGIIALALGIWSFASDYGSNEMQALLGSDIYLAASIITIVGGTLVIATAVLGGIGAFLEHRVMLSIYFGLMLFFLIAFVVAAVLGFFFRDELEDKLAEEMENSLLNKYFNDSAVTEVWDDVQKKLKCCGVKGGLTGPKGWFLWQSSYWFANEGRIGANSFTWVYVPGSCCNTESYTFTACQERNLSPTQPPQPDLSTITTSNPALYDESCIQKLKEEINSHIIAIAVISCLTFVVLVLCVIFSLLVLMRIRTNEQQVV